MKPLFVAPVPLPRRTRPPPRTTRHCPTSTAETPTPAPAPAPPKKTPTHRRFPLFALAQDLFRQTTSPQNLQHLRPVYKCDVLGFPVTIISHLPSIRDAYISSETFRSNGAFPPPLAALFGPSALFILDGPAHRAKRTPVLPAFSPALFPCYLPAMRSDARELWRSVTTRAPTPLPDILKAHYLGTIVRLTTGEPRGTPEFARRNALLLDLAAGLFSLPIGPVWGRATRARAELLGTLSDLIYARLADRADAIAELRAAGPDRIAAASKPGLRAGETDLLTVLVASSPLRLGIDAEQQDATQVKELAELCVLLWFAGYSTQASATLCCVMEIGFDTAIRDALRAEQDAAVAAADGETDVTMKQVNGQMPLLDSYITEVLRLYPPAPIMFRKTSEKTVVLGHEIPEGVVVGLDTWGAQRDAEFYAEPERLMVDRFVRREGKDAAPAPPGIVSFGAVGGAHFCLGAALAKVGMKVTLATMLREFDVVLDPDQSREYVSIPEVQPSSGVRVASCSERVGSGARRVGRGAGET